jgi:hypothetical protein
MPTPNSEEYFPDLKISVLKAEVKGWLDGFPEEPIKRIVLYRYSRPPENRHKPPFKDTKAIYAVVFELDADDKTIGMSAEELESYHKAKIRGERTLFPGERLLDATGQYQTVVDNLQTNYFFPNEFACVYKSPPASDFHEEWVLRVKFNNAGLDPNIRREKPHRILYPETEDLAKATEFISYKEAITVLNIAPFQLVQYAKEGRITPYTQHGKRVCDAEIKEKHEGWKEARRLLELEKGTWETGLVAGTGPLSGECQESCHLNPSSTTRPYPRTERHHRAACHLGSSTL